MGFSFPESVHCSENYLVIVWTIFLLISGISALLISGNDVKSDSMGWKNKTGNAMNSLLLSVMLVPELCELGGLS